MPKSTFIVLYEIIVQLYKKSRKSVPGNENCHLIVTKDLSNSYSSGKRMKTPEVTIAQKILMTEIPLTGQINNTSRP